MMLVLQYMKKNEEEEKEVCGAPVSYTWQPRRAPSPSHLVNPVEGARDITQHACMYV